MTTRLSDRISGRDNNLNLIRMLAACAVLVSHAFPIALGKGSVEPLEATTGMALGGYAVAIFFFISGFLISRSFDRRPSLWHWFFARILRLFPALLIVLCLTAFVLGPLVATTGAGYWLALEVWTYVPRNLSLAFLQYPLPGVFEANPYGPPINGSLWTLFYEVVCYAMVLLVGVLGLYRRPKLLVALIAIFLIGSSLDGLLWNDSAIHRRVALLLQLGFPFALGMGVYTLRDKVGFTLPHLLVVWAVAAFCLLSPLADRVITLALCYSVLYFAYVPRGVILGYNKLGDFSYGTYIYAFPMQQLTAFLLPGSSWLTNIAVALPLTFLLAILSWKLVEKPSLAMVGLFARPLAGSVPRVTQ